MGSTENWFPHKDMSAQEVRTMTALCGGPLLNRQEDVQGLFERLAMPMLQSHRIKQLLVVASIACAGAYEVDTKHGARLFRLGALFYTGVLAKLSPLAEVPCEPAVFSDVADSDGHELIWAANERLGEEIPAFCAFLDNAASALDIRSSVEHHLVTAGAGLIHILTMSSLGAEDARSLEQAHPELADLEAIFAEIEGQQGSTQV